MTRGLSQWHEHPRLQDWVQRRVGRLALWLTASLLLVWHDAGLLMLLAFAAVLLWPARRHALLSLGAVGMLAERFLGSADGPWPLVVPAGWLTGLLVAAAGTAALYLVYRMARLYAYWPTVARNHPVLTVHAVIWFALALSPMPWLGVLAMVPFFAWRLSYLAAMASRRQLEGTDFADHLFYLVPVYGGTTTPYGKGLAFLGRHEATTPDTFAKSQLAGLKLLLLAVIWRLALDLLDVGLFGRAAALLPDGLASPLQAAGSNLPRLAELLQPGTARSLPVAWAVVYLELVRATLALAATGHVIVGSLRLFGFNVFRNTYKPLLSESVLEFWNRYYYYFKELLVDFFFYPVYLRLRRLGPSARLFAAVFAAAFVGNMYHHLLADPELIVRFDPERLWATWAPRGVYCFLLALGIWVSMLRQKRLRAAGLMPGRLLRLRRIAGVWTFYAIIQIWNIRDEAVGVGDCTRFFLSLAGL